MMNLPFNPTGFARPTNRAEFQALLAEAFRLSRELREQIDAMEAHLVAQVAREAVPA